MQGLNFIYKMFDLKFSQSRKNRASVKEYEQKYHGKVYLAKKGEEI